MKNRGQYTTKSTSWQGPEWMDGGMSCPSDERWAAPKNMAGQSPFPRDVSPLLITLRICPGDNPVWTFPVECATMRAMISTNKGGPGNGEHAGADEE